MCEKHYILERDGKTKIDDETVETDVEKLEKIDLGLAQI